MPEVKQGKVPKPPRPVLVLVANTDGTDSMRCSCLGFEHWHVIRSERDLPAIYREGP